MNYIVLSGTVYEALQCEYEKYCEKYNYTMTLDTYVQSLLMFEGVCRLYNRCWNESSYAIIGKGCILYADVHNYYPGCFFGKRIRFFEDDTEYLSKLTQTVELPGEWSVIRAGEANQISTADMDHIGDVLDRLKGSYKEFGEFAERWKNWDTYNSKLKEAEEEKELASENLVKQAILENNVFSIIVSQWKEEYKADADVSALFTGEKRFVLLGKIEGVNAKELKILVRCETDDIIWDYFKNSIKKYKKYELLITEQLSD